MSIPATLTRTEARILRLLSDGMPHARKELLACLPDAEYASLHTLQMHVYNLRKKLPLGEAILLVSGNAPAAYIRVRLLSRST